MEKQINFAILGAGNIAEAMAEAVNGIIALGPQKTGTDIRLYAVGSRSLEKAQAAAERWGAEHAYGSYEELVKDDAVDLIYIATPHSEHYANAKLCIGNNRACLVEKPFCANREMAQELISEAAARGVFIAEAMWTRFQPVRHIIAGLLAEGVIGQPRLFEADFSVNLRGIERLEKPSLCGGALLDLGIYSFTVVDMFWGSNVYGISTSCEKNEYGVDLHNETVLTYEDGRKAILKSSFGRGPSNYARLTGSRGALVFGPINAPEYYELYDEKGQLVRRVETGFLVNGYEYEVMESCRAVIEGRIEPESMPHSTILHMMSILDSLRDRYGVIYPCEKRAAIPTDVRETWGENAVFEDANSADAESRDT